MGVFGQVFHFVGRIADKGRRPDQTGVHLRWGKVVYLGAGQHVFYDMGAFVDVPGFDLCFRLIHLRQVLAGYETGDVVDMVDRLSCGLILQRKERHPMVLGRFQGRIVQAHVKVVAT